MRRKNGCRERRMKRGETGSSVGSREDGGREGRKERMDVGRVEWRAAGREDSLSSARRRGIHLWSCWPDCRTPARHRWSPGPGQARAAPSPAAAFPPPCGSSLATVTSPGARAGQPQTPPPPTQTARFRGQDRSPWCRRITSAPARPVTPPRLLTAGPLPSEPLAHRPDWRAAAVYPGVPKRFVMQPLSLTSGFLPLGPCTCFAFHLEALYSSPLSRKVTFPRTRAQMPFSFTEALGEPSILHLKGTSVLGICSRNTR